MGFFSTLGQVLSGDRLEPEERERLSEAWKVYGETTQELPTYTPQPAGASPDEPRLRRSVASQYDAAMWRKKLKTVLGELPGSRAEWASVKSDIAALELNPGWVRRAMREEFVLLIRRAVSDFRVTRAEHEALELARDLIELPEADAEKILREVVAEAEAFFGKPIRGA